MRRWGYFFGVLAIVVACAYSTATSLPTTTAAADGTDVGLAWSGPPGINDGFAVNAVSCVSSTFCMAVGDWSVEPSDGADAMTFDGNNWSDPSGAIASEGLTSLSCTSETFCMATGYGGDYTTFDGSTWSASNTITSPPVMLNGATRVSCATPLLCVAVSLGEGTAYTYDGSTWSLVPSVQGTDGLTNVSCTAPSTCVVAGPGLLATFDGTTWTVTSESESAAENIDAASCATPTFCVTINIANDIQVFDGTGWTDDGIIDAANPIVAVSCIDPSYCAAVDEAGNVVQYDGTAWSVGPVVDASNYPSAPALDLLSCASSTFCVAIDQDDDVFYNSGGTWTTNTTTVEDENGLQVSCVSPTFCVGVDGTGKALTFDGDSWTGPSSTGLNGAIDRVSCASSTFCMAVDGVNQGFIYGGLTWTPTSALTGAELSLVSCPTAGSCVGVGFVDTYIFSDGSWTQAKAKTSNILISLSCASATFCGATDESGNLYIFNGSTWTEQSDVMPSDNTLNWAPSISCPAVGFCMAVDNYGDAITYEDGAWSLSPIGGEAGGLVQAMNQISCATTSFCVGLNPGGITAVYENGEWTQIAPMGAALQTGNGGNSISCPTTSFCVGMDGAGLIQYLYPDATATVGGATVGSAPADQTVTYSATVSAQASDLVVGPTGQVDFAVGSLSLCSATLSNGKASCASSAAPTGQDTVTTQYSGDIYHAPSADTSEITVGEGEGPPTVSIVTPAEGAVYGVGRVVHAEYSCQAPEGTTVTACSGPVTSGSDIGTSLADVGVHQFSVEAMDADGQTATAATTYTVVAAPHITSFSPAKGAAGAVVTINGTNLSSATTVMIGTKAAHILTDTASTITFDVPAGVKTGFVSVVTPGGTSRSTSKFKVKR